MREELFESGVSIIEETQPQQKLQQPCRYQVVLVNDDYTPMDFVIGMLCNFFNLEHDRAVQVMLQVHTQGKGVCGVYSYDVAKSKVAQVSEYLRRYEYPLLCIMEAA